MNAVSQPVSVLAGPLPASQQLLLELSGPWLPLPSAASDALDHTTVDAFPLAPANSLTPHSTVVPSHPPLSPPSLPCSCPVAIPAASAFPFSEPMAYADHIQSTLLPPSPHMSSASPPHPFSTSPLRAPRIPLVVAALPLLSSNCAPPDMALL